MGDKPDILDDRLAFMTYAINLFGEFRLYPCIEFYEYHLSVRRPTMTNRYGEPGPAPISVDWI